MLDHRMLTQYFSLVHLWHSARDFLPVRSARYIVKHRRRLGKCDTDFHFLDETDAVHVHVVVSILVN